uniref:Uncharacterized protein n=1 Tax=Anguilla anguilla TaxID=7936 RepID=A0A0E9V4Z0_ANGAN
MQICPKDVTTERVRQLPTPFPRNQ